MPEKKDKGFIAYADFQLADKAYKAGDIFALPAGWSRDMAFDEFRKIEKQKSAVPSGLAFVDPHGRRQILPVQEA